VVHLEEVLPVVLLMVGLFRHLDVLVEVLFGQDVGLFVEQFFLDHSITITAFS